MPIRGLFTGMFLLMAFGAVAQNENMDESKVNPYSLPELLTASNGKKIQTEKQWEKTRRPEVLALFQQHVYGRIPGRPSDMHFVIANEDRHALEGKATRKEVTILFTSKEDGPALHLLLWLPNDKPKAPVSASK